MYLKPNTKYTISRENTIGYQLGYHIRVGTIRNNLNSSTWFVASHANNENKQATTITTNEDGIVVLYFNNTIELIKKCLEIIGYLQIEQGETATPYEPYIGQRVNYTPTNPMYSTQDGSIADYVDVEKRVEVYNIKFITLNGSESGWYKYKDLDNGGIAVALSNWANRDDIEHSYNSRNNYYLVDNFKYTNVDSTSNSTGLFLINKTTTSWIVFTVDFATLEEFKQWASENPITVGYVSLTPTETPIPLEDLAKMKSLKTNSGINNIFINGEVKPTIEARYPRNLALVQQQLEQKVLLMSEALTETQANLLLQGGN